MHSFPHPFGKIARRSNHDLLTQELQLHNKIPFQNDQVGSQYMQTSLDR